MARLPEDLITAGIIPRLPAKSIGRFRCVSKPWRSLLSSSKFVKSHIQIHRNDPEDILLRANYGLNGIDSIDFSGEGGSGSIANVMANHPYTGLTIFQLGPSCDGLVLALLRAHPLRKITTVLVNPVTRENVDLSNHRHSFVWRFGLGFGYDKVNDDYKIVALICNGDAQVYSVRRKTWRSVSSRFPYSLDIQLRRDSVYINGVFAKNYIYWTGGYCRVDGKEFFALAAFDLSTEKFEEVPLPIGLDLESNREWFETYLLNGFLALVFRDREVFDIWVMKEHGVKDSWTNVAKIEYPVGHVDGQIVGEKLRVIGNLHGDENIVTFWDGGKFFSYNMKIQKWGFLDVAGLDRVSLTTVLVPFRGSLLSLNSQEEGEE